MIYLQMFFGGCLGGFLHVLVKIAGVKKRFPLYNFQQVWNCYWKEDWDSVLMTIVGIVAVIFFSSEFLDINPEPTPGLPKTISDLVTYRLSKYIKVTSVAIGYSVDGLVYYFFGTLEILLRNKAKEKGIDSI